MVSVAQVHSACRLARCAQPSGPFKPQAELRVPPSSPEDVRRLLCAAGAMYKGAVCRGCLCAEDAVCRGCFVQLTHGGPLGQGSGSRKQRQRVLPL